MPRIVALFQIAPRPVSYTHLDVYKRQVLIYMNLGVFNLLPVPALDGGRLVFLLIEWIRGKPIDPRVEGYVHFVGICALLLLMVFATFQDVVRLF